MGGNGRRGIARAGGAAHGGGFVNKGELRRENVDLNELAREAASVLDADAREHAVRIQLELQPGLPPVCVDAVQIEQVILNLVRNGIEAVRQSEGRQLLLRTALVGYGTIEVSLSDTGIGISAEVSERIFDPFFSTKTDGLGMGLSISGSIVEAHGGCIWVTANADCGTTFHLTLPLEP